MIELGCGLLADNHVMSALTADLLMTLGHGYVNTGPIDEQSYKLFAEVIQICRSNDFLNSRKAGSGAYSVAHHLEFRGGYVESERAAWESIAFVKSYEGHSRLSMWPYYSVLGGNLLGQKRFTEAQRWLLEGYQTLLDDVGPRGPDTGTARSRRIKLYEEWGGPEESAKYIMPVLRDLLDGGPDAGDLNRWIWSIVRYSDLGSDAFALAVEAAERAIALAPDDELGLSIAAPGRGHPPLDLIVTAE